MLKRSSLKDKKMSGKFPVIEPTQTFCWICHQETLSPDIKKERAKSLQSNYTRPPPKYFRPCLCKGTMGCIHEECLNRWVLEKYKSVTKKPTKGYEEDLPTISCPNCKTPYVYNLYETKQSSGQKGIKLNSAESIIIFLLISLQLALLIYQYFWTAGSGKVNVDNVISDSGQYIQWSDYCYYFTLVIVLMAGGYNLLESSCIELRIEVLNQF
jgi:hypothetical protein